MNARRIVSIALLACGVCAPAGCKDETLPSAQRPIVIGTLTSISGDLASLGQEFTDATSVAVSDINDNGGVLGREINLVEQDDGTSPDGALGGYAKLLAARVPVILGPTTSEQVVVLADTIARGNTLTIGRTTTADQLRDLPDNGYFFRLTPADVYQSDLLAKLVIEANLEHLCLVHRRDAYGNNLAKSVEKHLAESGKKIAVTTANYNPANSDLSGVIDTCHALVCPPAAAGGDAGAACAAPDPSKVGLMLLTFVEDGKLILDDAQGKGWSAKKQRFFFADGVYDSGLLTLVKDRDNLEGAIGTAPSGPDPSLPEGEQLRKFVARYKARFGREPSIFVENAYDAMYVAAIAMQIAKTATPGPAVRDAMAKVSVPGGKKVRAGEWADIRATIERGEPIDFEGASGHVDFDASGDVTPPYSYVVWRVTGGALTVAERRIVGQ